MSVSVGDNVMYSKDMAGDVIKLGEENIYYYKNTTY